MTHAELFGKSSGPERTKASSLRDAQRRIVALIDMDCFYVQVEQRLAPEWKGKPCAVVQYNEWKGGGLIAVGYEARAMGVHRKGMRGEEAREVCPDIKLFKVPEVRGKADLTRYREAATEVFAVLSQFGKCRVERASVDEAYVDMTDEVQDMMSQESAATSDLLPNTYIVGTNDEDRERSVKEWLEFIDSSDCLDTYNNSRLAYAAVLVERMRLAVKQKTGFSCSAGISHNKVLSKLACGLHKPQKQTILSMDSVPELFTTLAIGKVRNLGGKLGKKLMEDHGIQFMGDICKISKEELLSQYGEKTANFLYNLCRGHDPEPVNSRQLVKSVGCGKNFRGHLVITDYKKARHWIHQMSEEVEERLVKDREQNRRIPKSLSLHVSFSDWQSVSRAIPISRYSHQAIATAAMAALTKLCGDKIDPGITCLGLSAGKFEDIEGQDLNSFFQKGDKSTSVDPFESMSSPTRRSNPATPMKPSCDIKSYLNGSTVSPFDTTTTSPSRDLGPVTKSSKKPATGCDIKSYISTVQLGDPFDILAKSHPRVYDNGIVPVEPLDQASAAKQQVDMKSFVSNTPSVDPFSQLDTSCNQAPQFVKVVHPAQTTSIKAFLTNNIPVDPFAGLGPCPRRQKVSRPDLKWYPINNGPKKLMDAEHTLYDPKTYSIDMDILAERDFNTLNEQELSHGSKENRSDLVSERLSMTPQPSTQACVSQPTLTLPADGTNEASNPSPAKVPPHYLTQKNYSRTKPMNSQTSSTASAETTPCPTGLSTKDITPVDAIGSSHQSTSALETSSCFDVTPQKDGKFLNDLIEIWTDGSGDEEGKYPTDEHGIGVQESSGVDSESQLSFFQAIEREQRLFHQLNSKAELSSPTALTSLVTETYSNQWMQRGKVKHPLRSSSRRGRQPRRPREPRQTKRHGLSKRIVNTNTVYDVNDFDDARAHGEAIVSCTPTVAPSMSALNNCSTEEVNCGTCETSISSSIEAPTVKSSTNQQIKLNRLAQEEEDISIVWQAAKCSESTHPSKKSQLKSGRNLSSISKLKRTKKTPRLELQSTIKDFFS